MSQRKRRKKQVKDIWLYSKFILTCKRHPWLFNTPLKHLERLFFRHYQTLKIGAYFDAVMSHIGATPKHSLSYYRNELMSDNLLKSAFLETSDSNKNVIAGKFYRKLPYRESYIVNYYALVRETKPGIVIETGTAAGALTSLVLSAMHKNSYGRLISIDIPPKKEKLTMSFSLSKNDVGLLIPHPYRELGMSIW